jgi:hypothetical protein
MVHSLAVKVQASSIPKVSPHAFALLAFEPITSTNQNSSATIALKAIAEMQVSADSKETCNAFRKLAHEHQCLNRTQPIFQLIDVSVTNFQLILIVESFQLKQELVDFSLLNAFSIAKFDSSFKDFQCQSSISINAKANSAKLIDMPMSLQNAMIHLNSGSSQFIVKYIFSLGSEGAHSACRFIVELDATIRSCIISLTTLIFC